jgi:hypothetical protein
MKENYDNLLQLAGEVQKQFKNFYLAGGTAIMFRHRHRQSYDLDFFRTKSFSYNRLATKARDCFPVENEIRLEDNIDFFIRNIKVSFVFFPFENRQPVEELRGVNLASDYDLFLNKIYVAGRRVDPKDSFDTAFLYRKHRWNKAQIKADFEAKFPDQSYEIYLGALLHFEDYPGLDNKVKEILTQLL